LGPKTLETDAALLTGAILTGASKVCNGRTLSLLDDRRVDQLPGRPSLDDERAYKHASHEAAKRCLDESRKATRSGEGHGQLL
jgi:hypothetical protein